MFDRTKSLDLVIPAKVGIQWSPWTPPLGLSPEVAGVTTEEVGVTTRCSDMIGSLSIVSKTRQRRDLGDVPRS
jgi:hypothetical protein